MRAVFAVTHSHRDATPRVRISLGDDALAAGSALDVTLAYTPQLPGEAITESFGVQVAGGNGVEMTCTARAAAPKVWRQ